MSTIGNVWGGVSTDPANGQVLVNSGPLEAGGYDVSFWLSSNITANITVFPAVSFRVNNTQLMRAFENEGGLMKYRVRLILAADDELKIVSQSGVLRRVAASIDWERIGA